MIGPIVRVALRAIRTNPLRAGLTMLGVIIGVGAVVAMVALGAGARAAVAARVQNLGSNLLIVVPSSVNVGGVQQGLGAQQTLMWDDALAIKDEVPQVEEVAAEFSRTAQVVFAGANTATSVVGVTPAYQDVRNHHVVQGAFFTDEDMQARARVAVVGPNVVESLFGSPDADPIGANIKINRSTYTVIGVLEVKSASGSSTSRDDGVLVPLTTAQKRLFGVTYVRQTGRHPAAVSSRGRVAVGLRRRPRDPRRGSRRAAAQPDPGLGHNHVGAGGAAGVRLLRRCGSVLRLLPRAPCGIAGSHRGPAVRVTGPT